MTYTKPEVSTLGNAIELINAFGSQKNQSPNTDPFSQPAYDLDE